MDIGSLQTLGIAIPLMIVGIYLLVKGGDWTVDGAVYIAERWGISHVVIGFTIVAFGTSLPELLISVISNLQGSPGIAYGNVIGSNIANILCVLGITAMIATIHINVKGVMKDVVVMLLATVVLVILMLMGDIGRLAGLFMVALLVAYVWYQYHMALKGELEPEEIEHPNFSSPKLAMIYFVLGLVFIAGGAELLVRGAKMTAEVLAVPEAVIALSIIAFGTSLPELSTCIIAARKGHSEIVMGNILGSNVFNILMIIGVTALIKPLPAGSFAPQLIEFDIWIMSFVTALLAALIMFFGKITKQVGYVFLFAYMAYNIYIYAIYVAA